MMIMYGYEIRERNPEPEPPDELKYEAYRQDTGKSYHFKTMQEACNFAYDEYFSRRGKNAVSS
jgi:hypothetical protein